MAKVERGVVKPPNLELQSLAATRSHSPLASGAALPESRHPLYSHAAGGSADLGRRPSPIATPDHRFNVETAKMAQPPSAIEPGKGAVPVNPFLASGPGIARAATIVDDAKQH